MPESPASHTPRQAALAFAALLLAATLAPAQVTTGVTPGVTPGIVPASPQTQPQTQTQTQAQPQAQPAPPIQPLGPGSPRAQQQQKIIPLARQATLTPDLLHLIELESRFSADVARGGGKAFASWFAPDGVTLSNGQAAVLGQRDIAAHATWDPKNYQLTWVPEGAQLSPSGDMGFTWGHYAATTTHPGNGQPSQTSGRYITIWKHLPGGDWKVALDASADDAPAIPAP